MKNFIKATKESVITVSNKLAEYYSTTKSILSTKIEIPYGYRLLGDIITIGLIIFILITL